MAELQKFHIITYCNSCKTSLTPQLEMIGKDLPISKIVKSCKRICCTTHFTGMMDSKKLLIKRLLKQEIKYLKY